MLGESHRFQLGVFECIVVNDGNFAYHDPASVFFANASGQRLERALREYHLDSEHWEEYISPYPSLVIQTGQHRLLVDTGAGRMAPTTGNLIPNLQANGIPPEEIDRVIITHGHPDHVGGLTDHEGKPAFPNARYVMWESEWEYWTSEPDLAELPVADAIKELILAFARRNLPPIRSRLDLVDDETEILPGIQVVAAPGHTPGHMAVAVRSGHESLLCASDAAIHPIHIEQPDWYAAVDSAPEQALASRRRLMERAVAERALVHAFHFPFPGLGHIVPKGDAWQWRPVEAIDRPA